MGILLIQVKVYSVLYASLKETNIGPTVMFTGSILCTRTTTHNAVVITEDIQLEIGTKHSHESTGKITG